MEDGRLFHEKKGYITDVIKSRRASSSSSWKNDEEGLPAYRGSGERDHGSHAAAPDGAQGSRVPHRLREEAFLEIRPGYVDSGAAPGKDTAWKDPAQLKPETTTKEEVAARAQAQAAARDSDSGHVDIKAGQQSSPPQLRGTAPAAPAHGSRQAQPKPSGPVRT